MFWNACKHSWEDEVGQCNNMHNTNWCIQIWLLAPQPNILQTWKWFFKQRTWRGEIYHHQRWPKTPEIESI